MADPPMGSSKRGRYNVELVVKEWGWRPTRLLARFDELSDAIAFADSLDLYNVIVADNHAEFMSTVWDKREPSRYRKYREGLP